MRKARSKINSKDGQKIQKVRNAKLRMIHERWKILMRNSESTKEVQWIYLIIKSLFLIIISEINISLLNPPLEFLNNGIKNLGNLMK